MRILSVIKGLIFKLDLNLNSKFDTLKLLHSEDFKGTGCKPERLGTVWRGTRIVYIVHQNVLKHQKTDSNNHLTRHSNLKVGWWLFPPFSLHTTWKQILKTENSQLKVESNIGESSVLISSDEISTRCCWKKIKVFKHLYKVRQISTSLIYSNAWVNHHTGYMDTPTSCETWRALQRPIIEFFTHPLENNHNKKWKVERLSRIMSWYIFLMKKSEVLSWHGDLFLLKIFLIHHERVFNGVFH